MTKDIRARRERGDVPPWRAPMRFRAFRPSLKLASLYCLVAASIATGCQPPSSEPPQAEPEPCPLVDLVTFAGGWAPMGDTADLYSKHDWAGSPDRLPVSDDVQLTVRVMDMLGEPLSIEVEGGASITEPVSVSECLGSPGRTLLLFDLHTPDVAGPGAIRLMNGGREVEHADIAFVKPAALSLDIWNLEGQPSWVGEPVVVSASLIDEAAVPMHTREVTWTVKGPAQMADTDSPLLQVKPTEAGKLTISGVSRGFQAAVEIDVTPAP